MKFHARTIPGDYLNVPIRTDEASAVATQPASSRFRLSDADFNRWFQRRHRLLAMTRSGPARRCCRWLGVRLQAWGLALQRYAQAGAAPAGWEEQPS